MTSMTTEEIEAPDVLPASVFGAALI